MGWRWAPRPGRFILGKDPVPIVQEAGWAPGPVWRGGENLDPHRDSIPQTVQHVASRYTDWAISADTISFKLYKFIPSLVSFALFTHILYPETYLQKFHLRHLRFSLMFY